MIKPIKHSLVGGDLQVTLNNTEVSISRLEALKLRIILNSFINGELEEQPEEDDELSD